MKRRVGMRSWALALALVVTGVGCGGGGGGGGGVTTPPPPTRSLTWTPSAAPGDNSIYMDVRDTSNVNRFVVEIRVRSIDDLYGLAFDLLYPASVLNFDADAVSRGPFLTEDGAFRVEMEVDESPDGTILIGLTRVGDVRGRNGDGLVLRLPFDSSASGSGDLTFANRRAINQNNGSIGARWIGGTIQVQR